MFNRSAFRLTRLCFYYRHVGFLPLPEKKETGGEDAFVSTASVQAVLDGVSWWRDNAQVDAGLYSAAVARSMYDYVEEDLLGDVPVSSFRLLEKGYEYGKHSDVQGTCTALVATLQEVQPSIQEKDGYKYAELVDDPIYDDDVEQSGSADSSASSPGAGNSLNSVACIPPPSELAENHLLDVVFVGDCSFMVLRDGRILYVSEEQQHNLDYPYQLGSGSKDVPSDGVRLLIPVRRGDVVLMGSDGVFDNVYPKHLARILWDTLSPVYRDHGYPNLAPEAGGPGNAQRKKRINQLADDMMIALHTCTVKILEVATSFSKDIRSDTPYASKCIEDGALYEGGKPDDMTVLVSVIGHEEDDASGDRFSTSETAYPVPYRDWP